MVSTSLTDFCRRRRLLITLVTLLLCVVVVYVQLRRRPFKKAQLAESLTKLDLQQTRHGMKKHSKLRKGQIHGKGPAPFLNNRGKLVALEKPGRGLVAGGGHISDVKDKEGTNSLVKPNRKDFVDGMEVMSMDNYQEKMGKSGGTVPGPIKAKPGLNHGQGDRMKEILGQGQQERGTNLGRVQNTTYPVVRKDQSGSQLNKGYGLQQLNPSANDKKMNKANIVEEPGGDFNGRNRANKRVNLGGDLDRNRGNMRVNLGGDLDGNRGNMHVNLGGDLDGNRGNMRVNGNRRGNKRVNLGGDLDGNRGNMRVNLGGDLDGNRGNMHVNLGGDLDGNRGNMRVNLGDDLDGNRGNMRINPSGNLKENRLGNMRVSPKDGLNGNHRGNMRVNLGGDLDGNRGNMRVNSDISVNPGGDLNGGNPPPSIQLAGDNSGDQKQQQRQQQKAQMIKQRTSGKQLYVESTTLTGPPLSTRRTDRQEAVVKAFRHAWKAYTSYAWGKDEVNPVDKIASKSKFGMGMTLVDSLDTMWLMGLRDEFSMARKWVADNFNLDNNRMTVSLFETTIRVLGGLLSTYHLSEDKLFLDKAVELGRQLLPAFDTPSDIPTSRVTLNSGKNMKQYITVAEAGTLQLEFRDLSRASGDPVFKDACDATIEQILSQYQGIVPQQLDIVSGRFSGRMYSVGSGTDSYYEYLLKQWLQSGKTETKFRDAYLTSTKQVLSNLVGYSKPSNMAYLGFKTNLQQASLSSSMDHLSCFYPGMLVLGVMHGLNSSVIEIAEKLVHTCYSMYNSTLPTHLAPEVSNFNTQTTSTSDIVTASNKGNCLRPETVESLFYLYRLTKKEKYRDWAWQIFQAFEKHSKLEQAGYTSLLSVYKENEYGDKMDSFFLAETLKYFYLLFEQDNRMLALDQWVFNTEGHPLPIWENTPAGTA